MAAFRLTAIRNRPMQACRECRCSNTRHPSVRFRQVTRPFTPLHTLQLRHLHFTTNSAITSHTPAPLKSADPLPPADQDQVLHPRQMAFHVRTAARRFLVMIFCGDTSQEKPGLSHNPPLIVKRAATNAPDPKQDAISRFLSAGDVEHVANNAPMLLDPVIRTFERQGMLVFCPTRRPKRTLP